MSDMNSTITPKSDQMNADDFIGKGSMTIKITDVKVGGSAEQPVSIFFEGDNGKPYKACKSMRRVLVYAWGNDSKSYIGRSMTLFRDEKVKWAGTDVGGIRISHLSHITEPMTMALSASKGNRKPYTVKPLEIEKEIVYTLEEMEKLLNESSDMKVLTATFNSIIKTKSGIENLDRLKVLAGEVKKKLLESK